MNAQSHLNGHQLANLSNYFKKMYEQWEEDNKKNKGYVWTISIDDTTTIKAFGLASVDYEMKLNCSHVGESMFGIYRGSMAFRFHGDIGGLKVILGLLGIKTTEDLDGWFRNDDFIMNIKQYNKDEENEFIDTFDTHPNQQQPELTGDPVTDAAKQAGYDYANNLINSIFGLINQQPADTDKEKVPTAFGYDWDTHMSEGDLGEFFTLNGGWYYWVNAKAETDSQYTHGSANTSVQTFVGSFYDNVDEQITSPFPHTIKLYPDGTVSCTVYNYKDTLIPAIFNGKLDCIDVKDTIVVKP